MDFRASISIVALACAGISSCSSSGSSGEGAAKPATTRDSAVVAARDAAPAAPARASFDRSKLAADTEPCMGRPGAHISCIARVATGNRPKSLGFSPDSKELWVALHYDRPALAVYDTETFALIGAVEMGKHGAVEVAFSHDGSRVFASQFETATVYEIDRATRKVVRTLATGSLESKVVEVSPDDKTLWVANWKGHSVSEFDLTTGTLTRQLRTPGIPRGLHATADGKHLYVAGYSPGRLYRIDRASGELTIVSEHGKSVRHLVADASRGRIYASDLGAAELRVFDTATGSFDVLAKTDPKANTIDLTPDGRLLFASCRGLNNPNTYLDVGPEWGTVIVFDALTGRRVDALVTGNQSTGLDVSPDGRLLATSDFLDNRVNIYEIPESSKLLEGDGGASKTYRKHVTKKGDWGHKRPRDPSFWNKLSPPAPSDDEGGQQDPNQ